MSLNTPVTVGYDPVQCPNSSYPLIEFHRIGDGLYSDRTRPADQPRLLEIKHRDVKSGKRESMFVLKTTTEDSNNPGVYATRTVMVKAVTTPGVNTKTELEIDLGYIALFTRSADEKYNQQDDTDGFSPKGIQHGSGDPNAGVFIDAFYNMEV